jgi:nucleoside-diphosphate-sugar epimerase
MIAPSDLGDVVSRSRNDLEELRGARILVTGGTGFVGTWLLKSLDHANRELSLDLTLTLITRNAIGFSKRQPGLAGWVKTIECDITSVGVLAPYDFVIHGATPANATLNDEDPATMRRTIVAGMQSLLDGLEASGAVPLLFTSSGAVYGPQLATMQSRPEDHENPLVELATTNAYVDGKREAEAMTLAASLAGGPSLRLARLFAFVGPYLPLDTHFAIGNFIRDGISGGPIKVRGDGTAIRSYMYAADMVVALLAILVRGEANRPYNVGSPEAITMRDLAHEVERCLAPGCGVEIAGLAPGQLPTGAGNRYVPDVNALQTLLGNDPCQTPLDAAIRRTGAWAINSGLR